MPLWCRMQCQGVVNRNLPAAGTFDEIKPLKSHYCPEGSGCGGLLMIMEGCITLCRINEVQGRERW